MSKVCVGCRIQASDVCAYCSNTGRGNVWLCNIFSCNARHVNTVHPKCKCGAGVYYRCKVPGCESESCRSLKCRLEHQAALHPLVSMEGKSERCPLHDIALQKPDDATLPVCTEKCAMSLRWPKRDVIEWRLGYVKALVQAGERYNMFPNYELLRAGFLLEFTHRALKRSYRNVCETRLSNIFYTQTLRNGELVDWIVVELK